jgi:hypothetical protein
MRQVHRDRDQFTAITEVKADMEADPRWTG